MVFCGPAGFIKKLLKNYLGKHIGLHVQHSDREGLLLPSPDCRDLLVNPKAARKLNNLPAHKMDEVVNLVFKNDIQSYKK